jgi:type II secretory pathway pseudopilin PulG
MSVPPSPRPSTGQSGFTRSDLLAAVALAVVLVALALPALAKPSQRTLLAQCSANLRQFAMATHLYAAENRERLPSSTQSGSWAWDLPSAAANSLASHGATPEVFYCPAIWENAGASNVEGWWNSFSIFAVIGYAHTFNTGTSVLATNLNPSIIPRPIRDGSVLHLAPTPSQRVMLADAVISLENNLDDRASNTYAAAGGLMLHTTSHMEGALPAGGNLAMLDGSVVWRPFADMRPQTSSRPYFWW